MAKLRLPTVLRPLAGGVAALEVEAATLAALPQELHARFPALAERVYDGEGRLRDFVNVFVDGEDARYLDGAAPLERASEIQLLPAISGG